MSTSNSEPLPTETCHTPSPWGIEYHGETLEVCVSAPVGRKVIASIETGFDEPFESQQHANCRLIAAAPDLLAALKELLASQLATMPPFEAGKDAQNAWSDRRAKARDDAAFVIAKAEGRS